ncbi:MAG: RluA family pseudouridine synthase [Planctomycetaceae bacterium]|jgi:RluA family pseudouridine synthase|nr:RluA family pseudouridine synthase [Planctomycetaceae bacterium]
MTNSTTEPRGFDILYEAGPVLGINKPAGVLTQAPPDIDSLEKRVKKYLCETEGRPENGYLGIPHRLDRPVSGVILFGKHSRAAHRLSEQFERREIKKIYWALVAGHVENDNGTWVNFMRKIPDTPRGEIVSEDCPDAKKAVLHYIVVRRFKYQDISVTKLEITLETGRMHQIRLQSSFHAHPVLGDAMYQSAVPFDDYFDDERRRSIALHAVSIAFTDPMLKQPVTLTAPLPQTWHRFGE